MPFDDESFDIVFSETAPASGATPTSGSLKQPGCFDREVS